MLQAENLTLKRGSAVVLMALMQARCSFASWLICRCMSRSEALYFNM
jgi:hypothetical protein